MLLMHSEKNTRLTDRAFQLTDILLRDILIIHYFFLKT